MDSSNTREVGRTIGKAIADRLGPTAYEAYKKQAGGLTYDGKPMPDWDALGAAVQTRWIAAGSAVSLFTLKAIAEAQRQ